MKILFCSLILVGLAQVNVQCEEYQHFPFQRLGKELQIKDFLSLEVWRNQKNFIKLRLRPEKRAIGLIIDCVGTCLVGDGISKVAGKSSFHVHEGEEILTKDKSYLWFVLFDGTMVRLGENSSLTLVKHVQSAGKFYSIFRVAEGAVFVYPREISPSFYNIQDSSTLFLPLPDFQVSRTFLKYEVLSEQKQNVLTERQANYAVSLLQHKKTLYLHGVNNKKYKTILARDNAPTSEYVLVFPNATIHNPGLPMDTVYFPGKDTWFRIRPTFEGERDLNPVSIYLRTFSSSGLIKKNPGPRWWKIDYEGKKLSLKKADRDIYFYERYMNYFPSLLYARELMLNKMMERIERVSGLSEDIVFDLAKLIENIQAREQMVIKTYLKYFGKGHHPGLSYYNKWNFIYNQKYRDDYLNFSQQTLDKVLQKDLGDSSDAALKKTWIIKALIHDYRNKKNKR
jgi:hypothetical protein